ncbi:MAG: hypothetical protein U9Q76_05595 [candidate division WOR-3 bacterium]|nr:hypothetical protein [candidate division WOR-3 bacterium]
MSEKSEERMDFPGSLLKRVEELRRDGYEWGQAYGKSCLEHRVKVWPSGWGDDLEILVYGDFESPDTDFHIESLGITVHAKALENTVIGSAKCVLKATVEVEEKSVEALVDAARRINLFLGTWALVTWGNSASGWWSRVTHDPTAVGVVEPLLHKDLGRAINSVLQLPHPVRQRVDAALYWIREPRTLFKEFYRNDLLRTYAAYWNAFECLVEAVNIVQPQEKLSKSEKQQMIDEFVSRKSGRLTPGDVQQCYQEIVNPGFVGKASHALRVCFDNEAMTYIDECFKRPDEDNRLYNIRNAINHGEVDAQDLEELLRIESRLHRLWMIVWRMFGRIVSFPAPADSELHQAA